MILFIFLSVGLYIILSYTKNVFGFPLRKEEEEASTLCSSSWVVVYKLILSIGMYSQMTPVTLEEAS